MVNLLENASSLQRDIARTLLYFDIFRHPLRFAEIHKYLPSNSVSVDDVQNACSSEPLNRFLVQTGGFVCLDEHSKAYVEERWRKERRARRMWRIAVFMSHIIRRFPYVRGIFVSGELSKGVASRKSDIDFFVITTANRVWITRTLFVLFKRVFLFNSRKLFCYNHITSETKLEIPDQNIYTAMEIATLRPVYNIPLYRKFMEANSWIKNFLPNSNSCHPMSGSTGHGTQLSEKIVGIFVSAKNLDSIDLWLLEQWRTFWSRRYHFLSSRDRTKLFQCETHVSTAYVNDFFTKITREYSQRLEQFGLSSVRKQTMIYS